MTAPHRGPTQQEPGGEAANGTVVRWAASPMVRLGVRHSRSAAWFNLQPSVLLVVQAADANVIDTVDRIYAMLPELKRGSPPTSRSRCCRTAPPRSAPASATSVDVPHHRAVMLVVFLFLRRVAATPGAGVTVPLARPALRRDVGRRFLDRQSR